MVAFGLALLSATNAVSAEPDARATFRTTLENARTQQIADAWPLLVIDRVEAFHHGWSIAAFAPVRGQRGGWTVSLTHYEPGQPPVNRITSSTNCPGVQAALSSLAEVDLPHLALPGYPSTDGPSVHPVLDGPGVELWSSAAQYMGNPSDEDSVDVTVSSGEYSRLGRAVTAALANLSKCQ